MYVLWIILIFLVGFHFSTMRIRMGIKEFTLIYLAKAGALIFHLGFHFKNGCFKEFTLIYQRLVLDFVVDLCVMVECSLGTD